jgi:hypothetical protein
MGFGWKTASEWFTTEQGQFVLYVGNDGKLYYGGIASNAALFPTYMYVASASAVNDSEWHEAICWLTTSGDADANPVRGTLLLDGASQGYFESSDSITTKSMDYRWRIGSGFLYYTSTTLHWPQTSYYGGTTNSNGACEADIKEARLWCGIYTGESVIPNALMFSCNT